MCGSEPCRHEKADGIASLIAAARLAATFQAERDTARAVLDRVRALATLEACNPTVAASVLLSIRIALKEAS